jgi:hypothetical protein
MAAPAPVESTRPCFVPATIEALVAILEHYGFDYFFSRTLPMINFNDEQYAEAVDGALDKYREPDLSNFSVSRAFRSILNDVMEEHDFTEEEALEVLAEEDYVVPVTTALYYSVDAGETDVERLSVLIQNRAKRLLKRTRR